MARKKKISSARIALFVAIILLIALAALAWQHRAQLQFATTTTHTDLALPQSDVTGASAEHGVNVQLSGKLQIAQPPRDAQLGVNAADAVLLLRSVSMIQWQEHCDNGTCSYDTAWAAQPVDSGKFRIRAGHENPPMPFADARFAAGSVRLGELETDPELVPAQHPAVDFPVKPGMLPPNLAATFSVIDGVLYAGGDALHPRAGTLRISYRIVPAGEISLSGIRRGSRLEAR
jgi:hypothetical protein